MIYFVAHRKGALGARIESVTRRFAPTIANWLLVLVAIGIATRPCFAQDSQAQAQELSDHAFSMLNSINSSSGKAGPILAPAASLAGDAQSLSTALGAHDEAGASSAMAAVLSDRDKIEAAAKIAGGQYPLEWSDIREKIRRSKSRCRRRRLAIDCVERDCLECRNRMRQSRRRRERRMPDAPKIEIESRVFKAGTERVKGFLEGTDLKTAGIFDGDRRRRDIDVASVPGEQRINFDFSIDQPATTQSIRVSDSYGREARRW